MAVTLLQLSVAGIVSYSLICREVVGCKVSAESVWHVGVGCVYGGCDFVAIECGRHG